MDKSMYGKMSDDRRTKESPTCGLTNRPTKEGVMSKDEMKEFIKEKVEQADYINIEIVYGLILGLFGE